MLTPEQAREFRLQLQHARENALKDAEAFDGIIHVIERLGSFLMDGKGKNLRKYKDKVWQVAKYSALATDPPELWRRIHTPFSLLYDIVTDARNDAVHIGAAARHLTTHAIELALILEDALRMIEDTKKVSDYMVRDVVCAELWHPVSFVRQRMLTNSFSFLPVMNADREWCLVSDLEVARYLQGHPPSDPITEWKLRQELLATRLEAATQITLLPAGRVVSEQPIDEALKTFDVAGKPVLVFTNTEEAKPVGILTAFDLL